MTCTINVEIGSIDSNVDSSNRSHICRYGSVFGKKDFGEPKAGHSFIVIGKLFHIDEKSGIYNSYNGLKREITFLMRVIVQSFILKLDASRLI